MIGAFSEVISLVDVESETFSAWGKSSCFFHEHLTDGLQNWVTEKLIRIG
jgi:hypothetical protein